MAHEQPAATAGDGTDGLRAQAVGSVGWVALGSWGARLSSLVVFSLLGRLLAPEDFGLLALAAVFVAALTVLVESGFSRAVVQRRTLDAAHTSTAFWTSLGSSVLLAGLLCAVAPLLERLLDSPGLAPVLMALSASLPLSALSAVPSALLEREFRFRQLAVRRLVSVLAGAVLGVALAVAGAGVWALVGQTLGAAAVGVVVLWGSTSWRPRRTWSREAFTELWRFARSSLGIDLLLLVNAQADKLVVGAVLGPEVLGYYFVGARTLQLLFEVITGVIGQLSLTTFARLQDDLPRLRRALSSATFVSACVAFPAFGFAAALAGSAIPLLYGDQWDRSVAVMQVLAPAYALLAITYFDKSTFMAVGKPAVALRLTFWQTLVGLAATAVAAPFGAVAVSGARAARQFAFWPVRLALLQRHVGVAPADYSRRLLGPLVATALPVVAVLALQASSARLEPPLLAALVLGAGSVVAYVLLLDLCAAPHVAVAARAVLGDRRADRVLRLLPRARRASRRAAPPPAEPAPGLAAPRAG